MIEIDDVSSLPSFAIKSSETIPTFQLDYNDKNEGVLIANDVPYSGVEIYNAIAKEAKTFAFCINAPDDEPFESLPTTQPLTGVELEAEVQFMWFPNTTSRNAIKAVVTANVDKSGTGFEACGCEYILYPAGKAIDPKIEIGGIPPK
ncbi:hypothetical protein [Sessilibacter corallicola]|uniref:hypothetical protein n=1 Tax=Sessilibacter corallicola TaxID=2904075 RepID=UPI001E5929FA|nr:hypothetical protein [Sessilibacter corallicola]MCE2027418.1 hypothetical protein [Sessilibacter corallicola]